MSKQNIPPDSTQVDPAYAWEWLWDRLLDIEGDLSEESDSDIVARPELHLVASNDSKSER